MALKEYILKNFPDEDRIGVALPSCFPGIVVNLAIQMAGKSSVNVNFTMGPEAAKACLERVGIKSIIGSDKVREKVSAHSPDYPWTDKFYDIGKILKQIGKKGVLPKLIAVRLLPGWLLSKIYKIPSVTEKGSVNNIHKRLEGMPKAAILTHRNIMANSMQMWQLGIIDGTDTLHETCRYFIVSDKQYRFGFRAFLESETYACKALWKSKRTWTPCARDIPQL
ncbi:MAG: hypothetical protein ACLUKN_03780 [Bacilli bacterium]